jgi:hypothetical protein
MQTNFFRCIHIGPSLVNVCCCSVRLLLIVFFSVSYKAGGGEVALAALLNGAISKPLPQSRASVAGSGAYCSGPAQPELGSCRARKWAAVAQRPDPQPVFCRHGFGCFFFFSGVKPSTAFVIDGTPRLFDGFFMSEYQVF